MPESRKVMSNHGIPGNNAKSRNHGRQNAKSRIHGRQNAKSRIHGRKKAKSPGGHMILEMPGVCHYKLLTLNLRENEAKGKIDTLGEHSLQNGHPVGTSI